MFTIVDVVLEASPDSLSLLHSRVLDLVNKEDPGIPGLPSFVRTQKIANLHFMSLQIFDDRHFDPVLIFENNFDGDCNEYWTSVLDQIGEDLRRIFACTKAAATAEWSGLFKPGAIGSLLPFLKNFSVSPSASHIGAVGVPVDRIRRDEAAFLAIQTELAVANPKYSSLKAVTMHKALQTWAATNPLFGWLKMPETSTIGQQRTIYRFTRVIPLLPFIGILIFALIGIVWVCRTTLILPNIQGHIRFGLAVLSVTAALAIFVFAIWFWITLRHLEETDPTQADPILDPEQLASFATLEDQIVQNHLASIVLVKPGAVRSIIIHASLYLLRLWVPLWNYNGYLGAMRTIHFAHWTLIGNGSRMLFLSNFDGSWQSYLDDFIDKAATGLTLAWANCVGFPPTKDLVIGGATRGREFKAWARQSQTTSPFWYSAYKDLTVNQILQNAAIVDGLRKTNMTEAEANEWAALL
jgi:hypothetical protein